jgi:LacI family transcriptional regulator, galactose operon repressor
LRGESLSRPAPKRVGIRDVAAQAGVAISTVSKVLSGQAEVSEVLGDRVRAAAEELGYRPNFLAQSLRRRATNSVGFVASDLADGFGSSLAAGAEHVLRDAGYAFLVVGSRGDPAADAANVTFLHRRLVDAIIIAPSRDDDAATLAALDEFDGHVAVIESEMGAATGADSICTDHRTASREATHYLLDLGHRRIAILPGPLHRRSGRERLAGMLEAMEAVGHREHAMVLSTEDTWESGERATAEWLSDADPPTAMIVGSEPLLEGVLRELDRHELDVGRDLSLLSWGESRLTQRFHPPIAVVDRDARRLGELAAHFVIDRLETSRPAKAVTLPTRFLARASCAPPRKVAEPQKVPAR